MNSLITLNDIGVDHPKQQQFKEAEMNFFSASHFSISTSQTSSRTFFNKKDHVNSNLYSSTLFDVRSQKQIRSQKSDGNDPSDLSIDNNKDIETFTGFLTINENKGQGNNTAHKENYHIAVTLYNLAAASKHTNRLDESYTFELQVSEFAFKIQNESDNNHRIITVPILPATVLLEYMIGHDHENKIFYTKALRYCRDKLSNNKLEFTSTLHCIGMIQYDDTNGNKKKSMMCFNEVLCIRRMVLGNTHVNVAHFYNNIDNLHFGQKQYEEARIVHMKAKRIRAALLRENHTDAVTVAFNIEQIFNLISNVGHALTLSSNVLSIIKDQHNNHKSNTLTVIKYMVDVLYNNNEIEKAKKLLKHILLIERDYYGSYHPILAVTLDKLGGIFMKMGKYDSAINIFQLCILIRKKNNCSIHPNIIISMMKIAQVKIQQNNFDEARNIYLNALSYMESSNASCFHYITSLLRNMANMLYQSWEYRQSLIVFYDLFTILPNVYDSCKDEYLDDAFTITDIGTSLRKIDDNLTLALQALKLSLQIQNAVPSVNHRSNLKFTLFSIGMIYEQQCHFENALEYYKRTMSLEIEMLGKDHQDVAKTLTRMGDTEYKIGDLDEALLSFERAIQIKCDDFDTNYFSLANLMWDVGNIYLEKGGILKATETFTEFLRLYERFGVNVYDIFPCENMFYILGLNHPKAASAA